MSEIIAWSVMVVETIVVVVYVNRAERERKRLCTENAELLELVKKLRELARSAIKHGAEILDDGVATDLTHDWENQLSEGGK